MQEFVKIPLDLIRQTKRGSPFSETDALADILSMADENGEFYSSTRKLMSRWGWSNTKVVKLIRFLEEKDAIKTQKRQKKDTLYSINKLFTDVSKGAKKTQKRRKRITKQNEHSEVCARIIEHLNIALGTKYRCDSDQNTRDIIARLREEYKEEDFYTVIDKKVKEWKGTKQERYLRPDTLFGNKFDGYLNQNIIEDKPKNKFKNFPERDYSASDYVELEKRLLRAQLEKAKELIGGLNDE